MEVKILEPDKLTEFHDNKFELMVVNKCPLKNIIKGDFNTVKNITNRIENVVNITHKLDIQIDQFLHMYLCHKYDNNQDFPDINTIFIKSIIRTITARNETRGKPPSKETQIILDELKIFHDKYYSKCLSNNDIINDTKMNFIMAYEANDIIKNIKTNISEHFIDHVKKFVNVSFNSKKIFDEIKEMKIDDKMKSQMKSLFYNKIKGITDDLLKLNDNFTSDMKYHSWLKIHRKNIIRRATFTKGSVYYDVCSNSMEYLKSMFYINKEFEKLNNKNTIISDSLMNKLDEHIKSHVKKNYDEIGLFNVIPKRTNIIPKYITLDSASLVQLFSSKDIKKSLKNITKEEDTLWERTFKVNSKVFKRSNYKFHHMIKTDGIGCSVLLIKIKDDKPIKMTRTLQNISDNKRKGLDKYIENIEECDKKKRVVTIDPNMGDLIYCVAKIKMNATVKRKVKTPLCSNKTTESERNGEEEITFRYTQNQRKNEIGTKRYAEILNEVTKDVKIENKTIKELETGLSKYNSKTVNLNKLIEYCKKKNDINRKLFEHYKTEIFRKLKMNKYINTQKSESNMIANFKYKYGSSSECIIVIGDYSGKHMKGKEPVICKRIRSIFRRAGYSVYLIDEYNTSKICNECSGECETFKEKTIKDNKAEKKVVKCWGLLRCKNEKCQMIHNRDKNSALNMSKIVKNILNGRGRPKEYCKKALPLSKPIK